MVSVRMWSAPTFTVVRSPGLGAGWLVSQPSWVFADTTRPSATQAVPTRCGFDSWITMSTTGWQQPSPTCSTIRPLLETVTDLVWPLQSPAKAAKDVVVVVGAPVLVTVTVTVFVVVAAGR